MLPKFCCDTVDKVDPLHTDACHVVDAFVPTLKPLKLDVDGCGVGKFCRFRGSLYAFLPINQNFCEVCNI